MHRLGQGGSAGLEQENSDLAKVEVDEVLGLVGDIGSEIAAHNAMPGGVVLLVELLLNVGSDVLLNVVLLQSLGGAVNSVLLHLLAHVSVLDHSFPVGHFGKKWFGAWAVPKLGFAIRSGLMKLLPSKGSTGSTRGSQVD